jgi:hypothetical protein
MTEFPTVLLNSAVSCYVCVVSVLVQWNVSMGHWSIDTNRGTEVLREQPTPVPLVHVDWARTEPSPLW